MSEPASGAATVSVIKDTVRMPWMPASQAGEKVVPPSLAILFRLALGPAADYYVPRFLRYERTGESIPSWHWPSLWLPGIWAFYRKLWLPGLVFATLPFAGMAAFVALEPDLGDSSIAWISCAAAVIGILPGIVPAMLANALLYRRIRRLVREAQTASERGDQVASMLTARPPTAVWVALLLGGGALALLLALAVPRLLILHDEHLVRGRVAASLAAVRPLQRQVEESWRHSRSIPRQPDYAAVQGYRGATFLDTVNLSPINGRLRLDLGPATTELSGKTILLAPALDSREKIQWLCIAIDVPAKFLPQECRNG
jgi:hypothetical protein